MNRWMAAAAGDARAATGRKVGLAGVAARSRRGFTLIELLVVLVIMGLLYSLVGPRIFGRVESSNVRVADMQIKSLKGSLQTYRLDVGDYPSTSEGLGALMRKPAGAKNWHGPYLEEALPEDPWRNPYRYQYPAANDHGFALFSLGADGAPGGEGNNADIGYLPKTGRTSAE